MDLGLAGRHYYITGISGGIGSAMVRALVAEGAFVHGCARGGDGLRRVAASLPNTVAKLAVLDEVDVTHEKELAASVTRAGTVAGRLDGVVACAGTGVTGSALSCPNEVWEQQFSVKVLGALNLVRSALDWLTLADHPRLLIINGVTAHHPDSQMAAVSASRAALANLGRSLAVDLAGRVSVLVVNLGAILTERQRARWSTLAPDQPFDEWVNHEVERREILAGRFGDPDEVGANLAFLLSPLADYISGMSIDIAGGSRGRL